MMKKVILFFLAVISICYFATKNDGEFIRLRVIPNSNEKKDIEMKELVKENINSFLVESTQENYNYEEYQKIINDAIPTLDANIKKLFQDNNYNVGYTINYGQNYFPEKKYKDKTFEEGYYESLVVEIGKGEGDNWWCFLFPPLCLLEREKESDEIEVKYFFEDIFKK